MIEHGPNLTGARRFAAILDACGISHGEVTATGAGAVVTIGCEVRLDPPVDVVTIPIPPGLGDALALRGLLGLPGAVFAILEGVAGPGYFPVLTRRWVLGWWTKYDPPKPSPGPARPARRRVVEPVPAPSERTLGVGACPNCRNEVDPSWGHCPYCEHRA